MRISLTDQQHHLADFLPAFKRQPLSYADHTSFPERFSVLPIPTIHPITDLTCCSFDFLFTYAIFPEAILQAVTEWGLSNRSIRIGDVIVQQAFLPPFSYSVKCIFAVRILAITQSPTAIGFQYGTIAGHAEMGISEFAFVLRGTNVYALIHTFSQPGHLLSRVVAPFFTLPYQQYCTNQALKRMQAAFIQYNPKWCTP